MSFVWLSIAYYFIANSIYLFLLVAAVVALSRQARLKPLFATLQEAFPSFAPPISILAPAYNEQETIVESVQSFLLLDYPTFEIVVINDGSKDETLKRLIAAFELTPIEIPHRRILSRGEILGTYRSSLHPNLVVIDKANGGKADALNVGLEFATHDIFCAVDSDSLLEPDALMRVATPFLENPTETIASGGTVRIANGSNVKSGRVDHIDLPTKWIVLMQIVEYTRAFLCGRIGWNALNSTLVISGAFGLFRRDAVVEVGGYTIGSIGEDMELILRLHRHFRLKKKPYSIVFIADPVCWTEAPENIESLRKQRDRWQRGLAESLSLNRGMFFNPRFGALGMIAFPYFFFVELIGPAIELVSLVFVSYLFFSHQLSPHLYYLFFVASVLYSSLLSVAAVLIEEIYFSKYGRVRHFLKLFTVCMLESFGYRQCLAVWRLNAVYKYLRGDTSWGDLTRRGFHSAQ